MEVFGRCVKINCITSTESINLYTHVYTYVFKNLEMRCCYYQAHGLAKTLITEGQTLIKKANKAWLIFIYSAILFED